MLSMASITVCNIINILGRRRQFVCMCSILILKDHSHLFFFMTTGSFYYYYNYVEHCKINFLAKLHDIFDRISMQDPAMVGATVVQL